MRAERLLTVSALVIAAALVAASSAATTSGPVVLQVPDAEATAQPAPAAMLYLGQRFSGPGWDLEIQDAFMVDSPNRADWSEVRLGVAFRTTGGVLPYLWAGFAGETGYPTLVLRDASGEIRTIPVTDPAAHAVPGSTLSMLMPGVPARWTIGFEVPTAFIDDLSVEAQWNDEALATWDLSSSRSPLNGWEPIAGLTITELNEPISWSDDLDITITDHTVLACGDPDTQHVTTGYGLVVEVTNRGTDEAAFPDVRYPDMAGIAIWNDGASARYSSQTHVITEDAETDPMRSETIERVMIPPETSTERMMVFVVPRDGRFVDVNAVPDAVILVPPSEGAVWLDLGSTPSSDFVTFIDCGTVLGGNPFEVDQNGAVIQPVIVQETAADEGNPVP